MLEASQTWLLVFLNMRDGGQVEKSLLCRPAFWHSTGTDSPGPQHTSNGPGVFPGQNKREMLIQSITNSSSCDWIDLLGEFSILFLGFKILLSFNGQRLMENGTGQ